MHEALPGSYFNSLLLNRYKTGSDYVSWHADDEPLYGPTPEIASVSFGCERDFILRKRPSKSQGTSFFWYRHSLPIRYWSLSTSYQPLLDPGKLLESGSRLLLRNSSSILSSWSMARCLWWGATPSGIGSIQFQSEPRQAHQGSTWLSGVCWPNILLHPSFVVLPSITFMAMLNVWATSLISFLGVIVQCCSSASFSSNN